MTYKSKIFFENAFREVSPIGLTNLRLLIEKDEDTSFFRSKLSGGIEFGKKDCDFLNKIEKECCLSVPFTISRDCEESVFASAEIQTKNIEWFKSFNTAKVTKLQSTDSVRGVYKYWENKINMCLMPSNRNLKYQYRKVTKTSTTETYTYPVFTSSRGKRFADWVFYCVQQTFKGTDYESIIPQNSALMSQFFDLNICPCTGQQSVFTNAIIFQVTDFIEPHSSNPASGKLSDGRINEKMGVSLKDLLENLKSMFRVDWFIDTTTGRLRIEHESFFINGYSYSTTQSKVGIDLNQVKYQNSLKNFYGNYKHDFDKLFGLEKLTLSSNKALNEDEKALDISNFIEANYSLYDWVYNYQYTQVDDFSFGNIKYDSQCVLLNEKGEIQKNELESDMFITYVTAASLMPNNLDKDKWVLLDCSEIKTNSEILPMPGNEVYEIVKSNCERTALSGVPNARLSATSLMRDYHRWERPFAVGLMNYSEVPNGLVGKGFNRKMYSVRKTKILTEKISIPFCCGDLFDTRKTIKLGNIEAELKRAEFVFSSEVIEMELILPDSCDFGVTFPDENDGSCLPKGTFLFEEETYTTIPVTAYAGTGICFSVNANWYGVRKFFADGECGSYYEDFYDEDKKPIDEC